MPMMEAIGVAKTVVKAVKVANDVKKAADALSDSDVVGGIENIGKAVADIKLPDASGEKKYMKKLPDASGEPKYSMKLPDASTLRPPAISIEKTPSSKENVSKQEDLSCKPNVDLMPTWNVEELEEGNRPSPRDSEVKAREIYGGNEQKSYKDGIEVPYGTPGSTRPDLVRETDHGLEAIEVKNYDLNNAESVDNLVKELQRQIGQRAVDLPEGCLQRVVLDIRGQDLSQAQVDSVRGRIRDACKNQYPDLPVDIIADKLNEIR